MTELFTAKSVGYAYLMQTKNEKSFTKNCVGAALHKNTKLC